MVMRIGSQFSGLLPSLVMMMMTSQYSESSSCRRYVWENIEVGYVQGMCDLAAPLLVIFDDGEH